MSRRLYSEPLCEKLRLEYEKEMAEVYGELVKSGVVVTGQRQKVDLVVVENVLRARGHSTEDSFAILTRLQSELDVEGRARMTMEFVKRIDGLVMEMAFQQMSSTLAEDQSNPAARGFLYGLAGETEKAIEELTKAIESGEFGSGPYLDRGRMYFILGDARRAMQDFDCFLASGEKAMRATAYIWQAETLLAEGRFAEGIRSLAQAARQLIGQITNRLGSDEAVQEGPDGEEAPQDLKRLIRVTELFDNHKRLPEVTRRGLQEIKADIVEIREYLGV
ncbi:MAG: hypothetical protein QGD94_08375 [Planctomycetia bacterium]|nr:hypothetical protein [Planctomycetia bacterium]